jgi:hypothetical protein
MSTPAFPAMHFDLADNEHGLTMRDYFAAKALPPLIGNFLEKELDQIDPIGWMDGLAMDAYSMADAMMKARGE